MIKRILQYEAKVSEDLKTFEANIEEACSKRLSELEKKGKGELKQACSDQGIPSGGNMEEICKRLLEEEKKNHAFDAIVSKAMFSKRLETLMAMSKDDVL